MIDAAAFWQRSKTAVRGTENIAWRFWAMLLGALKSGIAEIATAIVRDSSGEKRRRNNES